jgi:hypothetical protein
MASIHTVSAAVSLTGVTTATFNTSAQTAFSTGIATHLNVPTSAVTIVSFADQAAHRRHLLATALNVQFTVATPSVAAAAVVSSSLVDPAAAATRLAALQSAGLGVTDTAMDPDSVFTVSTAQAAALTSSAVARGLSVPQIALGVALVAATLF